ncbi:MAG: ThuA domain-containing protein [Gemmatimonadetes bacterium]|nr:ThuA domain-containing protein [Gemmatimonadota bacterium]NNM06403.1 ThuA domain-containing protein [Gemmatimonadota bacterium]
MKRIPRISEIAVLGVAVMLAGCGESDAPDAADVANAADVPASEPGIPPTQQAAMEEALPDAPVVPARQGRSLLIFNLSKGFAHESIPWVDFAIARMGVRTGAFEAVISSDTAVFQPDRLGEFDAVLFNNNTGEPFSDPALRASLLAFVRDGGGMVGLHAATDGFHEWPEFGEMMGGYFVNHPWNESVTLLIEEAGHSITAPFDDSRYVVADEIYQFGDPYSRERQRVLISLDTAGLDLERDGVQRADLDFAVSWIREEGSGRVFYSSLGHRFEVFTDPTILRHWLAGIQYALGDLDADATPRPEGR